MTPISTNTASPTLNTTVFIISAVVSPLSLSPSYTLYLVPFNYISIIYILYIFSYTPFLLFGFFHFLSRRDILPITTISYHYPLGYRNSGLSYTLSLLIPCPSYICSFSFSDLFCILTRRETRPSSPPSGGLLEGDPLRLYTIIPVWYHYL